MDDLIYKVDLAMNNSMGNLWQITEQTLNLGSHPTHALTLEIILVTNFFIEDMNIRSVFDKHSLLE